MVREYDGGEYDEDDIDKLNARWGNWREPFRIQSIEDLKRMYRQDLNEELEIDEKKPTLFSIPIVIDESVPPGEIHLGRAKWEYPS